MNFRIGLGILRQLVIGVDTQISLVLYLIISVLYDEQPSARMLSFSLLCGVLPDIDIVPYLMLKKRYGLISHWPVGHHPVWYAGFIALLYQWNCFGTGHDGNYIATLCSSCLLAHFLHDSFQPQGMYWFYPFKWSRITLVRGYPRWPDAERVERARSVSTLHSSKGPSGQIGDRLESVNLHKVVSFAVVITGTAVWWILA